MRDIAALQAIEAEILAGIATTPSETLDALAMQREGCLRTVCEALATLGDSALRRDTLLALAEANQRIEDAALAARDETLALSRQGAHQRRAISAYDAIDEGSR